MDAAIRVDHLSKRFGVLEVLRDITCEIAASEVVCVIGPSGSGKSTLLRCVNGLEEASSGQVHVFGAQVHDPAVDIDALRRDVGMVFQRFNLFPHKTVLENVMLAPSLNGRAQLRSDQRAAAEALLARVDVIDKRDEYPNRLSGGQQQRVAIARALAMRPRIMLFDEPTSSLDPEMVREVLDVIQSLIQDAMTMVIVTHEMAFARRVADRVLFLDEGRLIEDGAPEEMFTAARESRTRDFLSKVL